MAVDFNNSREVEERIRKGAIKGLVRATERLRTEMIRLIQETDKTGRVYVRRGIAHKASAPGEPPASDTGRLVQSITTEYNLNNLTSTVKVGAEYGMYLEFGTEKMEPRPFARPAAANTKAAAELDIATAIREELLR